MNISEYFVWIFVIWISLHELWPGKGVWTEQTNKKKTIPKQTFIECCKMVWRLDFLFEHFNHSILLHISETQQKYLFQRVSYWFYWAFTTRIRITDSDIYDVHATQFFQHLYEITSMMCSYISPYTNSVSCLLLPFPVFFF